jgi:serine/threonine protein kinase
MPASRSARPWEREYPRPSTDSSAHIPSSSSGAFSEVKNVTDKRTMKKYAMKIIDKSKCKGKEGMIDTEIDILTKVKHENIISMHDSFQIDGKIYLLMELCVVDGRTLGPFLERGLNCCFNRVTGGELFDDIVSRGKYTESDAARIVQKILLAVDYLHVAGIAHRDLKVRTCARTVFTSS